MLPALVHTISAEFTVEQQELCSSSSEKNSISDITLLEKQLCLTDSPTLLKADQTASSAKNDKKGHLIFPETLCLAIKTHMIL